jgi:Domain of unknown function (DUF1926)
VVKRYRFGVDGDFSVAYRWDPSFADAEDFFGTEISLFAQLELQSQSEAEVWAFPIETVAKSERGFDRTVQGESVTLRWKVSLGAAQVDVRSLARSFAHAEPATIESAE